MLKLILGAFFSRFLTAVLNFGTIIMISRKLGPEGKGLSTILLVTLVSVQMLCDFAGGAALVYLSPRFRLRTLLVPVWIWNALCSLGLMVFLMIESDHLMHPLAWQAAALCFVNASFSQHVHVLNGRQKFNITAGILLFQAMTTAGLLLLFLLDTPIIFDYFYALCISWGISWMISLMALWNTRDTNLPSFSYKTDLKRLFKNGAANQTGHLLQFLNQRIFYLFLPVYTLGIFSNAVALGEAMWMIAGSIATIQYGKIANMQERQEAAQLTARLFKATFWLTLIAVICVALVPGKLYELIFGFAFSHVKESLIGLLPGVLFLSGYLIFGHYFSGTGRFSINNYSIALGVIVTFAAFGIYHLVEHIKPNEIIASRITSLANMSIFISIFIRFRRDSGIPLKDLIPQFSDLGKIRTWLQKSM